MTVTETIIAKLQHLSAEDQRRVLDLVSTLPSARSAINEPRSNGARQQSEGAIWARLKELGEVSEKMPCDLPADLAANHDFYLHGLPKRP